MKTEELANSTDPEEVASGFRILKLTFFEILQMSFSRLILGSLRVKGLILDNTALSKLSK